MSAYCLWIGSGRRLRAFAPRHEHWKGVAHRGGIARREGIARWKDWIHSLLSGKLIAAVNWASAKGILGGYDNHDGTFTISPDGETARVEAAKVLVATYKLLIDSKL